MVPETESEQGVKDDDVRAAWGEYKRLVEDAMRQEAQDQAKGILESWKQQDQTASRLPPLPQFPKITGVRIKIWEVNHLPKMDTMGSCDPFVEVSATGSSQKPLATTTKRNTYNASFGEEFYVPLDQHHHTRGGGSLAELTLKVMDWDRVGSNDHIGDVRIALGEGSDPRRNYLRPGQQVIYPVLSPGGAEVKGNDKEVTTVTVTVTPTYESPGGAARGAKAERLFLMVALPSGSDMPVMDSPLAGGKCDPYCKVSLARLKCDPCCKALPGPTR